jgi:general secretion pathway protein L
MTTANARIERITAGLWPSLLRAGRWWRDAVAQWLPLAWRRSLGLTHDRLLLVPQDAGVRLLLQQGEALSELAVLPLLAAGTRTDPLEALLPPRLAALPRWLLLDAGEALRRRLQLPAAAADRLHEVLGFEVDRQTPFASDQIVHAARLLGRAADGQISAELVVLTRVRVQAALAAVGAYAPGLAGLDLAVGEGTLGVNLLPAEWRRTPADPWRQWRWALLAVALIALVAGMAQVLANRRAAADAFAAKVEALAPRARSAALARQQLQDLADGMRFLQQQRAARPTTVEILAELTRRLPADTYLEKLTVEDGRITLIGLSAHASDLVGRLEGSPLWRAPALAGAVQPDPRAGRDRFTLVADVADRPGAPARAAAGSGTAAPIATPDDENGSANAAAER